MDKSLIIVFLIFLASWLFFSFKLEEIPNGVYVDEATTGVNAHSILKTGKDEYGKSFPLSFRFFGSYSPPLYAYLTVLPVWIYGLSEFSVRIISVICACLMVFVIYKFLNETGYVDKKIIPILLILFIITPWNFFFARTGYELYLGFFLFSLGVLFCWLGLRKSIFLILGFGVVSLSTYASHPQLYSVPLFGLGFLVLFQKSLNRKYLIAGIILALIIQIPHFLLINSKALLNKGELFYLNEILINSQKVPMPQIIVLPVSFLYSFFARATTYFSPESLFFFSDPDLQRSVPEISVFYNWMVAPYLLGLYIIVSNFKKKFIRFLVVLLVAAVIPPSLTRDPFSTQRGLGMLLPLFLITSFGISKMQERISPKIFMLASSGILAVSLLIIWRSYFILLPSERAVNWNYGYKQLSEYIVKNPNVEFVIDQSRGKPAYIELAFFLRTDPALLQNASNPEIKTDYYNLTDFNPNYKLGHIDIRIIDWEKDIYKLQILVGDELAVSQAQAKEHYLTEVFTIFDPRGYPLFRGYRTNPHEKCLHTEYKSVFCQKPN